GLEFRRVLSDHRRIRLAEAHPDRGLSNSVEVFEFMQPRIGELPHEEFSVIYLNNANRVVRTFQLSKGGITGTLVDVRLLIKEAVLADAVGLILSHNHPSGTLRPRSEEHTSELQSRENLVCRLLLEKK